MTISELKPLIKFFLYSFYFVFLILFFGKNTPVFAACLYTGQYSVACGAAPGCGAGEDSPGSGSYSAGSLSSCVSGSQISRYCNNCGSLAEATACACGGGGGNTPPSCSITTNKSSYSDGEYINYQVNAGDNGEVFGGNTGHPQLYYPVISGSGCNSAVGYCSATNLCGNSQAQGQCTNVCTGTHLAAVNPGGASRNCTISVTVSNIGQDGVTPQTGSCSTTVTVSPPAGGPNLIITNFTFDSGCINNSTCPAHVTVRNIGNRASGNFKIAIDKKNPGGNMTCSVGDRSVESGNLASLSAGSSRTVNLNMPTPANPGNFTAAAMVDSGCQVSESNEVTDQVKTEQYSTLGSSCSFTITGNVSGLPSSQNTKIYAGYGVSPDPESASLGNGQYTVGVPGPGDYHMYAGPVSGYKVTNPSDISFENTGSCNFNGPDFIYSLDTTTPLTYYFQTFGGDVTSAGQSVTDAVPPNTFISGNVSGQLKTAGIVAAAAAITTGPGAASQQGFSLSSYLQTSSRATKNADYVTLLTNALKAGGFTQNDVATICSTTPPVVNGIRFSCWNGSNLTTRVSEANSAPQTTAVILSQNTSANGLINADLMNLTKNIILFVPGNVSVTKNVTVNSAITAGFSIVASGDVKVTDNSVQDFDGSFIFAGDFNDTVGTNLITIDGQIISVGGNTKTISFQRQANVGSSANITFAGKYLKNLQSILARPKTTWVELPPQ